MLNLLWELVRKDLRIYIADRRSVMISFLTPVILACFIGYLFQNTGKSDQPTKVDVLIVDQDNTDLSSDLIARMKKSPAFNVKEADEATAQRKVSKGEIALAVVVPKGFSDLSVQAMTEQTAAPDFRLLEDPSRGIEVGMAKGSLIRLTMQSVTKQVFGSAASTEDAQLPFKLKDETQSSDHKGDSSPAAHAFAGMAMQGLLFWAIESAMTLLRERRMGIWRRLRSSPVSPFMFLLAKGISAAIRAMAILLVVFGVGMTVFKFHIEPKVGNYIGFALVAGAASLMSATFGLFVAALGKNEQQSRGLSILAVLGMCMLGGAWFPISLMPSAFQMVSKAIPIAWAVDGFDGMIWRGLTLQDALVSTVVLLGFSVAFGTIAYRRIQWDPEPS